MSFGLLPRPERRYGRGLSTSTIFASLHVRPFARLYHIPVVTLMIICTRSL